jgi:hypothetical protein
MDEDYGGLTSDALLKETGSDQVIKRSTTWYSVMTLADLSSDGGRMPTSDVTEILPKISVLWGSTADIPHMRIIFAFVEKRSDVGTQYPVRLESAHLLHRYFNNAD